MWVLYASLSAIFTAINAILSKRTVERTTPIAANAIRTTAVLLFSIVAMLLRHGIHALDGVRLPDVGILLAAGAATTGAWILYFRALSRTSVENLSAIDKSSIILTTIGGALFLSEPFRPSSLIAILLITIGILQIIKTSSTAIDGEEAKQSVWWIIGLSYAGLMAISVLLSRVSTGSMPPDTALAIKTAFVFAFSWLILPFQHSPCGVRAIGWKTVLLLLLGGLLTGAGWLCSFQALAKGAAAPVHAVERLSLPLTVLINYIVYRRSCTSDYFKGLGWIVGGTLWLAFDT